MGLFKGNKDPKQSADDVKTEYANRIYEFLDTHGASGHITHKAREDPLSGLFNWMETKLRSKENPETHLAPELRELSEWKIGGEEFPPSSYPQGNSSEQTHQQESNGGLKNHVSESKHGKGPKITESHVKRLTQSLNAAESQIHTLIAEKQTLSNLLFQEKGNSTKHFKGLQAADAYGKQLGGILRSRDAQIEGLLTENQQSQAKLREERNGFERQMRQAKTSHENEIRDLEKNKQQASELHKAMMLSKEEENALAIKRLKNDHLSATNKLKGQLLVNQTDNQDWPGEKIKLKFSGLQRLIESITSPRNKEFLLPANNQFPPHIDTSEFINRAGRGKSHFLLKSNIWSMICEQFFCVPFGFGVLGPEKSRKVISEVVFAWRQLFDGSEICSTDIFENFELFKRDELANNWRSATFQCINAEISKNQSSNSLVVMASRRNQDLAAKRILSMLSDVASLSNAVVKRETEDQIIEVVKQAEEIALQMGVNSAHLSLLIPKHKQQIRIGAEFHDCEDGDSDMGANFTVDIMTAPGIQKIGDGKSDMRTIRTIVPCEIYPLDID